MPFDYLGRFLLICSATVLPTLVTGCVDKVAQFEKVFEEVLVRVAQGDEEWVRVNASRSFEVSDQSPERIRIRQALANISENIAVLALSSNDPAVSNAALLALYANDELTEQIGGKTWIRFEYTSINWGRVSEDKQIQLFDMMGNAFDLEYDSKDEVFLKNELCEAVDEGAVRYTAALIAVASFDPGFLRCVSGEEVDGYRRVAYDPESSEDCPQSLRRIAGDNYGSAVSSRVAAFERRLEAGEGRAAFSGHQSLGGELSMNELLDRYDKWVPGGNCTPDSLLRPGVVLPDGF